MKSTIFAVTACAALLFSETAAAMPTWTVTATGTIVVGRDTVGTFGIAGQDLAGLQYTQSITTSIDPADYVNDFRDDSIAYHYIQSRGIAFTTTVTVNGASITFDVPLNTAGGQYLGNFMPAAGEPDAVRSFQYGQTRDGNYLESNISVDAFGQDILDSIEFGQPIAAVLVPSGSSYSEFHLGMPNITNFTGRVETIAVVGNDVPEPASASLIGLGLFGIAARRRRARAHSGPARM